MPTIKLKKDCVFIQASDAYLHVLDRRAFLRIETIGFHIGVIGSIKI